MSWQEFIYSTASNSLGDIIGAAVISLVVFLFSYYLKKYKDEKSRKLDLLISSGISFVVFSLIVGVTFYLSYQDAPIEDTLVLLANFAGPKSTEYQFAEYIGATIDQELEDFEDIVFQGVDSTISPSNGGSNQAREIGENQKAAIIIWGWYSVSDVVSLHVHIESLDRKNWTRFPRFVTDINGEIRNADPKLLNDFSLQKQLADQVGSLINGIALYSAGEWEASITEFNQALEFSNDGLLIFDSPELINVYLGGAYYHLERYQDALMQFSVALEHNTENEMAHMGQAYAYFELGEFQSAVDEATYALSINPDLADAYFIRGLSHASLSNYDLAIEDYETAIGMLNFTFGILYALIPREPLLAQAYFFSGLDFYHAEDYEMARKRFQRAADLDPNTYNADYNLGLTYLKLEQTTEARRAFTRVVENSDDPDLQRLAEEQLRTTKWNWFWEFFK